MSIFDASQHLIRFTDPLSDTLTKASKIFCNMERVQRGTSLGKIVDVESFVLYSGRGWRVTPDGMHLAGPVADDANNSLWHHWYLGLIDSMPGLVVIGQYAGMNTGNAADLINVRYSDQRAMPGSHYGKAMTVAVDHWFKAASWAHQLFPEATDPDSVVTAKLELAEQRWMQRRAKTTVMLEGANRNYDQLEELIEDGDLPMPTFGAWFSGDVMLPDGRAPERDQRTVAMQDRLDRIAAHTGKPANPRGRYVSVNMELPLPHISVTGHDAINKVAQHTVSAAIRDAVNDYDTYAGAYSIRPVLRSAA